MKRISTYLIGTLIMLGITNAFADGAKIGVVDLQKIVQTSPQMKSIQAKLEQEFKPRRDKLVALEEVLKKDMDKFKRDNAIMSDSQKKDAERKLIAAQQDFERQGQQYQQELSTAHNAAMENLYDKIRSAIQAVATQDKYDVILQKDAAPYSSDKLDVTAQVMKNIH